MAAINVSAIIASLAHGATTLSFAQSTTMSCDIVPLFIKNNGSVNDAAIGIMSRTYSAVCTWMASGGSPITPGTSATLTHTADDCSGGGNNAYSLAHMTALGYTLSHADRSPAMYTQAFAHANSSDEEAFTA